MRKWEDNMTNSHKGKRDHPVELVEQLQIGLTIENKTLIIKLFYQIQLYRVSQK